MSKGEQPKHLEVLQALRPLRKNGSQFLVLEYIIKNHGQSIKDIALACDIAPSHMSNMIKEFTLLGLVMTMNGPDVNYHKEVYPTANGSKVYRDVLKWGGK